MCIRDRGKYHQVKRMVAAVGNHCERLHRSGFGPIALPEPPTLADPAPGQWRFVTDAERAALLAAGKAGAQAAGKAGPGAG